MKAVRRLRGILTTCAVFTLMLVVVGCGASGSGEGETVNIVINNDVAADTLKGESWRQFESNLSSKLGDQVQIEIFDSGSLYNQDDQLAALQQNNVQFIAPVPGVLSGSFPELSVFTLPYLFKSPAMIDEALNDPELGGEILASVEEENVEIKSTWLNGWRMVQTRDEPVESLEDVRGLRIRVPAGDAYIQTFETLGATPTGINWSEVPTSLQQGIIDAAEPTPNANLSDNLYEVAPYITNTDHALDFYVIATNKEWFDGLSADVQQAIEEALEETAEWNREQTESENEEALETMQTEGATFTRLDDEELGRWQDATQPVIEDYRSVVGSDVIDSLLQLAEKYDWERQ